jgi:hypothetical protein
VVQGVALELLCRLLFTEGSNPSLSVPSLNSLLKTPDQIAMETFIPPVRPFIDIDSLFRIAVTRKNTGKNMKIAPRAMIHKWDKIGIKPVFFLLNLRLI